MELEGSLPHLQQLATCPCSEPDRSGWYNNWQYGSSLGWDDTVFYYKKKAPYSLLVSVYHALFPRSKSAEAEGCPATI